MNRIDPRRMGIAVSAMIAALAVVVAALPMIQAGSGSDPFGPPDVVPRPLIIASLFALPAAIGALASVRRSSPLFITAGVLCLFQSFIAFSGVTLGFVLPGLLLISLGLRRPAGRTRGGVRAAGALVVAFGIAAWLTPFALSETQCWIVRTAGDGSKVYERVPVTDRMTFGPTDVGGGCDGGAFTLHGLMVGTVFAIGALAVGILATADGTTSSYSRSESADAEVP